jgi:hypothetical protein
MSPAVRTWHVVAVLVIAALPAANTLAPAVEHDTWWHLRIGQIVADSGAVPQVDPCSRMSRETPTPWRAYSWLYELMLYHVHAAAGYGGVMWLRSLLAAGSAAAVLGFWFRRAGLTPVSILFAALAAVVLMPLATERPWHFTIAFTAATAWAVTAVREGLPVWRVAWLPLLYILWANIHIQFVLGWGVLGLACLFPGRANRGAVICLTASCVLATVVNPYHVGLFQVIWEYATQGAPLKLVQELSAPDPLGSATAATWTAAGLALFVWAVVQVGRRRPIDWFEAGLLAAAAVLAVRMNRDIWFVAVAAAAVMRPIPGTEVRRWLVPVLVVAAYIGVRLFNSAGLGKSTDYDAAQAGKYPVSAVQLIQSEHLPGPIYNDFDWGGYLIWAAPEYPVSIDGRTNLYGNERLLRSFDTWSTEDGWAKDPDLLVSRIVLAQKGRVLTGVLLGQPDRWRVAYEDDLAVVFARRSAAD